MEHVPSDVGINQKYLPVNCFDLQNKLDDISDWTKENLMALNESKSFYIVYSRSRQEFSTRLNLNGKHLERLSVIKLLGIWLDEDLSWNTNTKEICKRAFSRMTMLSRLKYAGILRDDLLLIYKLFIRSTAEYCSVAFHCALTQEQAKKIELIQSTSLKIILGSEYLDYESAMKLCCLDTLFQRRSDRMLKFSTKCTQDKFNKKMFPLNTNSKNKEHYIVNFARTNKYLKSTIPQCQRLLNSAAK